MAAARAWRDFSEDGDRGAPVTAELTPQYVLADLFDSDDFPVVVPSPGEAAAIVLQRPADARFEIKA